MTTGHHDTVLRQFSQQAEGFAACPAHADDTSLSTFLALGGFGSAARILDSGCGPGIVSCYLAHHVAHVTGVDLTPAMIALANAKAADQQLRNVTFVEGNAAQLPARDGEFDGAVSRYTFHHLQTPIDALREMVRVTRPGGIVAIVDVAPPASVRDAFDQFERQRDPSHTSALTLEEWIGLGESLHLGAARVERFPLAMPADDMLANAYPEQVSRDALQRMLLDDIGVDRLGFHATTESGRLVIYFPLIGIAWQVPA
jgi:ubiquinone/menaquinone biosynthesis C-methylase UbiE